MNKIVVHNLQIKNHLIIFIYNSEEWAKFLVFIKFNALYKIRNKNKYNFAQCSSLTNFGIITWICTTV